MLSPLPLAYVAHATRGRTRLHFPSREGDVEFFSDCSARVAEIQGVRWVRVRSLTASLVIEHDGAFDTIKEQARAAGLFTVVETQRGSERAEAGPALPPVAAVLGGLAVMQLFRNHVLPPAITLLWYAASLAREHHAPSASAASVRSHGRSRSRRPT
jgi:hypothetical protein